MKQAIIANPVINSPFAPPARHFRFAEDGITDEIIEERRTSAYFIPVPRSRKRGKQMVLDTEWTEDRIEPNKLVNQIREKVSLWRKGGYRDVTRVTARLLDYWQRPDRERRLFFCQVEALETIIYLTEVASRSGDTWIENKVREFNAQANPELYRLAFKMATGSGKTLVMAMLITWHVINKRANPQDARFGDAFLIVTPGITIRDRLRVLLPNDPDNYYRQHDIVPAEQMDLMQSARMVITNYHAFQQREKYKLPKLNRQLLKQDESGAFTETPDQMVRRVCRELGSKSNVIIINDEAHHCYRRRQATEEEKLSRDDRWLAECLVCKDSCFPQMLLFEQYRHKAAEHIYQSLITTKEGRKSLRPILRSYEWVGSTRYANFDTTRPTYRTHPDKCHVSHVVADTRSWEQKLAQTLEEMDEVRCYVKNQNLGFDIPYTIDGEEHWYRPDYIVRLDDGNGDEDLLNLIIEVSGEARRDKAAKAATARNLWIPAINNDGRFGRRAFLEVTDPWDAKGTIHTNMSHSRNA